MNCLTFLEMKFQEKPKRNFLWKSLLKMTCRNSFLSDFDILYSYLVSAYLLEIVLKMISRTNYFRKSHITCWFFENEIWVVTGTMIKVLMNVNLELSRIVIVKLWKSNQINLFTFQYIPLRIFLFKTAMNMVFWKPDFVKDRHKTWIFPQNHF